MANQQATIVVKKVKKGGHGAHGGAWKIAYADFVTAMMAFFLLLWLLNSATQEALEGISNYFAPISISDSSSGAGGVLGGQVLSVEGAGSSQSGQLAESMELAPPRAGSGDDSFEAPEDVTEEAARKALEAVEQAQFKEAEKAIKEAIESSEELKQVKGSLKIDNTPDGLRIQLVDMDNFAMFASGSAVMNEATHKLIALVSKVILTMPQDLAIAGHTDAVPFMTDSGYGNWELSADRANAARRELLFNKVPEERVSRVVGRAATDPYLPEDPEHASNRRLSFTLLTGTGLPGAESAEGETIEQLNSDLSESVIIKESLEKVDESKLQPETRIEPEPEAEQKTIEVQGADSIIKDTVPVPNEINLNEEEEELGLPGLEQIKKKQLENAQ